MLLALAGSSAAPAEPLAEGTLSNVPVGLENSRGTMLAQLSRTAARFEEQAIILRVEMK